MNSIKILVNDSVVYEKEVGDGTVVDVKLNQEQKTRTAVESYLTKAGIKSTLQGYKLLTRLTELWIERGQFGNIAEVVDTVAAEFGMSSDSVYSGCYYGLTKSHITESVKNFIVKCAKEVADSMK